MTVSRQRGFDGRPLGPGLVLACLLFVSPASAQFLSDRPAPVPPASVPGANPGPAINLAPPSGPGAGLPQPLVQPGGLAPAPLAAPGIAPSPTAGQGVLALSARFGKDAGPIPGGLVWRIYAEKPDANGALRLMKEDRTATPNVMLPPGNYVVHASLGMASAMKQVALRQDTTREVFEIPAGGLRIEGRVGTSRIPAGQVTFDVFKGSQFDTAERAAIAQNVPAGDAVLLPEGTYYIISNYGDANSVVRSDIRVQAGKLTDVTVQHRAAVITLKLVSDRGGEALANTNWSVITPGGDVIKESIGAFPRVVLAEGEYRVIAKNEGKTYERAFNVVTGVDGEVEVMSR